MPFILEDQQSIDLRSGADGGAPQLVDPPTIDPDRAEERIMETHGKEPTASLSDGSRDSLRKANLVAGVFHLVSAVAFLFIMTDFALPITGSFATDDPALLDGAPPTEILGTPTIGWGVAAFSLLSALFHLIVATVGNSTYNKAISHRQNPFRWIEYSLSSSLMIVLISMLLGIYDVAALVAIAGSNVAMILFGWLMERHNTPGRNVDWYPFAFGSIAGLVPWVAIAIYLQGAIGNSDEAVPIWVWGILFSIFALFNCFAINQFLQYKQVGRWRSYVFGEGVYIALSFVAKTALIWQIYFGTVR